MQTTFSDESGSIAPIVANILMAASDKVGYENPAADFDLDGFRGRPPADLGAAADVILAVADLMEQDPSAIIELDINPLMLLAEGQGVVAADALISINGKHANDS